MAAGHVVRVPNSTGLGEILIHASSSGSHPLDLKLVATDGESPYVGRIKHAGISKLRSKGSVMDEKSFEAIIRYTLLQECLESTSATLIENLETIATISGAQLIVTLRRNISGIHQKLGEIAFVRNEDEEINFMLWLSIAIIRSDDLELAMVGLQSKYEEQETTLRQMHQQLENLIATKSQHEAILLEKFRDLLNEKKLKIRDQQRLLARAGVHSKQELEDSMAKQDTLSEAKESRPSAKRREAPSSERDLEEFESSNDALPSPMAQSPARSLTDEKDEQDDDAEVETGRELPKGATGEATKPASGKNLVSEPPTRRQLPVSGAQNPSPVHSNTEEDTTDDEL